MRLVIINMGFEENVQLYVVSLVNDGGYFLMSSPLLSKEMVLDRADELSDLLDLEIDTDLR